MNKKPYKQISGGIKSWAEDDRPREKMLSKSSKALSDAELLAIVIGSGTKDLSAVELSRLILSRVSNNLSELARLRIHDLMQFKGIGAAKAIKVNAVMELGRRRRMSEAIRKNVILSSKDAFEVMQPLIGDLPHEEFWIITLARNKKIQKAISISEGSVAGTVADPKKIFRLALENNAAAIIICHNHPSGQTKPSKSDIIITNKCKESGISLDMPVLDHLIVTSDDYYSFSDNGLL